MASSKAAGHAAASSSGQNFYVSYRSELTLHKAAGHRKAKAKVKSAQHKPRHTK